NSANGTALQLYTCQSVSQQQWTVPAVTTPITSTGVVDDDAWHHVVLTAAVDHQELFLDGQLVGSITGKVLDHRDGDRAFVGNGKAAGWPSYPAAQGNGFPFTGTIDDVAFYKH